MHLATVSIYECDGCRRIVALKTDDDWQTFDRDWYDGLRCQFCPACRRESTHAERLRADQETAEKLQLAPVFE